jgi:hypothetical protein
MLQLLAQGPDASACRQLISAPMDASWFPLCSLSPLQTASLFSKKWVDRISNAAEQLIDVESPMP